jgi:hypothetical protein
LVVWNISSISLSCYGCYRVAGGVACSAQRRFQAKVAPQQICGTDVRFGSKADIEVPPPDVRFTLESGQSSARIECPLSAKSGHWGGWLV